VNLLIFKQSALLLGQNPTRIFLRSSVSRDSGFFFEIRWVSIQPVFLYRVPEQALKTKVEKLYYSPLFYHINRNQSIQIGSKVQIYNHLVGENDFYRRLCSVTPLYVLLRRNNLIKLGSGTSVENYIVRMS
jgi:hypothetical protein